MLVHAEPVTSGKIPKIARIISVTNPVFPACEGDFSKSTDLHNSSAISFFGIKLENPFTVSFFLQWRQLYLENLVTRGLILINFSNSTISVSLISPSRLCPEHSETIFGFFFRVLRKFKITPSMRCVCGVHPSSLQTMAFSHSTRSKKPFESQSILSASTVN